MKQGVHIILKLMHTKTPMKKKNYRKNFSEFSVYVVCVQCNCKELDNILDKSSCDTEQDHMEMPQKKKLPLTWKYLVQMDIINICMPLSLVHFIIFSDAKEHSTYSCHVLGM